jgi:uncharacterized protein with HEPN domain
VSEDFPLRVAEAILALRDEVRAAAELGRDRAVFDHDRTVRLAGERMVERVFQSAEELPEELRIAYFGEDGYARLRGMRNRLAHNYRDTHLDILWTALAVDVPGVAQRLAPDAIRAVDVVGAQIDLLPASPDGWSQSRLAVTQRGPALQPEDHSETED